MVEPNDYETNNSKTEGSDEKKSIDKKSSGSETKEYSGGDDEGDDSGSGDDDGGDGDSGHNSDPGTEKNIIQVSSVAFAESEGHTQEFMIGVNFHAKIDNDDDMNLLLVNIDVNECGVSHMLNQNWKKLSDLGHGYFLESVTISVSPTTNVTNNRSQLYMQKYLFPREKYRCVASTTSIEKQGSLEIGRSPKVIKEYIITTVFTSDEWHLRTWGSSTTGDYWMYEKTSNNKFLSFAPGPHISKWIIVSKKMCGFVSK